ncbi:MAG: sigma-70 family RNA polymerase sigma factor [Anaerolineae bacterium]|jgi:DNA-directed RNA polymerase specialized sigma24 family protein
MVADRKSKPEVHHHLSLTPLPLVTSLVEILDRLPPQDRVLLSLFYLEGLSTAEIASVLGTPETRVTQLRTSAEGWIRDALAPGSRGTAMGVH